MSIDQTLVTTKQNKTIFSKKSAIESANHLFTKWCQTLSQGCPKTIAQLYADNAVLLATLSPVPLSSHQQRIRYFSNLMKNPDLQVVIKQKRAHIMDKANTLICGLYDFTYRTMDGRKESIPARFSMVFSKQQDKWQISHHHSSQLPIMPSAN